MADYTILLPSKPRVISEEGEGGVFEIEGLYLDHKPLDETEKGPPL